MPDGLDATRARQVASVEDAIERRPPWLATSRQRLQDDAALVGIEPARRHGTHRRIEHGGGGAELFRQRQHMAIEQVEQRRRRHDHGPRRQRRIRRIDQAELLLLDLEDALLDRGIIEQEHLLDQSVKLADGRTLTPAGAEVRDDVPLRPTEQAGEMGVPDHLIGGQKSNNFALCLHRAAP